jgi:hypothetical protein
VALALGALVGVLIVALMLYLMTRPRMSSKFANAPTQRASEVFMEAAPPPLSEDMVAGGSAGSDAIPQAAVVGAPAASPALVAAAEASMPRREVIYSGALTIEVEDVEKAMARVQAVTLRSGGWVSEQEMSTDAEGHRTTVIALRIPASKFHGVRDTLRGIGEVIHDGVHSQDVGKEFVDLEARLRNLEREEKVIAELFSRKGKIAEVLQVERELARVRGEVERIQGQLRYLGDQVAYSSLAVTLSPKRPAIERKIASWNLGYHVLRAWRALVGVARALTYFVVYTVIVIGPFALLAWIVWRGMRARKAKRVPKPDRPPVQEN